MTNQHYHPVSIPDNKLGDAEIKNFEITEQDYSFQRMRCCNPRESLYNRPSIPGKYLALTIDGKIVMSNTAMEQETNLPFMIHAKGDILIAGLGIGMILSSLLSDSDITSITVVEKNQNVIDLIAPHFKNNKLNIICADIFEYKTKKIFDTIYFDIWSDINTDHIKEIEKLHKKFKKNLKLNGWMNSWMNRELRTMKRQGL